MREPMMTLKTFAGKLFLAVLAIENAVVFVIGLIGVLMWFSGEALKGESSGPWEAFLASWLTFSRRVTLTFLIFGGLALLLRWVRSRTLTAPIVKDAEHSQVWFFLVTAILAVCGVLAVFFAQPLLLLFQEDIELLQSWGVWKGLPGEFGLIAFIPVFGILFAPGLAAMTALSFIAGAAASLAYIVLGLNESLRVLLRSICLQIPCLMGLLFTQALFETVRRIVEGFTGPDAMEFETDVLPWLAGQMNVLGPMAQQLAWLLPGFFFSAAVVLWKAHKKELGNNEIPMQSTNLGPLE
jgi:hypothetical protein